MQQSTRYSESYSLYEMIHVEWEWYVTNKNMYSHISCRGDKTEGGKYHMSLI